MDKKLKQLKETWNILDEFMKVQDYRHGSYFGSGTYSFKIGDYDYVMGADEFSWKGTQGLDVSFGILKVDDKFGHYVDYESNINEVDATDVIATVLDMTFGVAEQEMPNKWLLSFNPTKDKNDEKQEGGDTKRSKIYQRITKRIAKKYGWDMTGVIRMDKDSVAFIMEESQE